MDVHLRDLRYFVAVAEDRHMTQAAERLYVSQPALSKQIRALERQLGYKLFERHRHGVSPTPAGEALFTHARAVLDAWDEAESAARRAAAEGTLVIGIQTAVGRDLQRTALDRFRNEQPSWNVSLRLVGWGDPTVGLLDGSSDVALCWLPVPDRELEAKVLSRERRWVALPSGHRLVDHDEIAFADLLDEPFLALPEEAGQLREFWLATDERDGREPIIGGVVSSAEETFEAVTAGMGVVLLAEGNVELYARPGFVCRPVTGLSEASLAVVWRRRDRRAAVHALVESFADAAKVHRAKP